MARIEFWADSRHAGIYVNNLGSVDNVNELVRLGEDDTVQSIVLKVCSAFSRAASALSLNFVVAGL